jgi:hypothetical protein
MLHGDARSQQRVRHRRLERRGLRRGAGLLLLPAHALQEPLTGGPVTGCKGRGEGDLAPYVSS